MILSVLSEELRGSAFKCLSLFIYLLIDFLAAPMAQKVPGQGLDLSHSYSNAGSFNPPCRAENRTLITAATRATAETMRILNLLSLQLPRAFVHLIHVTNY